ncbi:hypothetical protein T484DRAFT_3648789 [Baffinella frigidus]|nr:hypothetical protein T484DRAFT_3648789 [Cryptophyta sp. CCMP2293]
MDTTTIYEKIQQMTNITERKKYIQTLTEEEKKAYTRYGNKLRQAKFNADPANKEKYNKTRAEHKKVIKEEDPEKYRLLNIKYVGDFRLREKEDIEKKAVVKTNYKALVTDAVKEGLNKVKKANVRAYQKEYREKAKTKEPLTVEEKAKAKAEATELKKEKKAEYMREYRKATVKQ